MRSKLFVPAIRVELFKKALGSGADALCFDLEDAVTPEARPEARAHLENFLANQNAGSPLLLVRANAVASSDFPSRHCVGCLALYVCHCVAQGGVR